MADNNTTQTQQQTQNNAQVQAQAQGTDNQAAVQTPANNDPTPEVTVESLLAQVAQLNASNAKLKADNDKLCTSEGNLRKQLRAKQTAEEQEAEALAEQQAQREEYVKGLEKFKAVTESSKRYLSMGMDPTFAEETATAELEGDMAKVTNNLTKFMADRDKKKDEEIRAYYMAQMPTPQSGNYGQVDYSTQIQQAINSGDQQAAALAILQQAEANKQFN